MRNPEDRQLQDRLAGDPEKAKLLQVAQRAWVAFRDAECAFGSSGVRSGSAQPMVENQCLADLTDKRNAELTTYATCEEGDLACPLAPAR